MLVGIGDASRVAMRRVNAAPRGSREFPDAGVHLKPRGPSGLGSQSDIARVANLGGWTDPEHSLREIEIKFK